MMVECAYLDLPGLVDECPRFSVPFLPFPFFAFDSQPPALIVVERKSPLPEQFQQHFDLRHPAPKQQELKLKNLPEISGRGKIVNSTSNFHETRIIFASSLHQIFII